MTLDAEKAGVPVAPERIWATVNGASTRLPDGVRQFIGGWSEDQTRPRAVEYVKASELDTARAEIERLGFELGAAKKIIAACAGALPNGAFIDPERASMDFMEMLPDEIHAVCAGMSDAIAKLQQDRRKIHELSATLRDKSTWNLPIQEAAQEIVLLSSPLPDPNAEPTNSPLSPVKENDRG